MKRLVLAGMVAIVAVLGAAPVSATNFNNFTITDFKSRLTLTRNDQKRSLLETRETITAVFPPNQNRGIERALPKKYDGHPVNLKVQSVTDESGEKIQYQTRNDNDNEILRIGNPNQYVSGKKTYVITYQQQDVTRFFADTNRDEFYWDINGTEWKVPIENISAELVVTPELSARSVGAPMCYQGTAGQSERCTITRDGQTIRASSVDKLNEVGENLTIAIGFQPGTFAPYQPSAWERFFAIALTVWVILQIGAVIVAIGAIRFWQRWVSRTAELGTIIPEYLPPKNASVQLAARIGGQGYYSVFSAQLLDLAVRHYIKLYQIKEKTGLADAEYEVELVKSVKGLRGDEREFTEALFGREVVVGERVNLKDLKTNSSTERRLVAQLSKSTGKNRNDPEWMQFDATKKALWKRWMFIVLLMGVLLVSPGMIILGGVLAFIMSDAYQLSDAGLVLRRYLDGLKQYIGVAEVERLRMLQSPSGVEKIGSIDENDPRQLIKLYEKVLPYAVLFGQERQWAGVLGRYYEQTGQQPSWCSGQATFSGLAFSSLVNDFGAVGTYSRYSSPSGSSSGGSTGGGYSGGGGGGGGGGGW